MVYVDTEKVLEMARDGCHSDFGHSMADLTSLREVLEDAPTADVVEVRHDFNVGDFCLYGYTDGNESLAIVEIVKILDDERGIAELKFHKVIKDNTGNGYFNYLLKSGHTMNGSFEYLRNITPCVDEERSENGT